MSNIAMIERARGFFRTYKHNGAIHSMTTVELIELLAAFASSMQAEARQEIERQFAVTLQCPSCLEKFTVFKSALAYWCPYCRAGCLNKQPESHGKSSAEQQLAEAQAVILNTQELLGLIYDKWENGDPCTSESGDSLGNAFQLSQEVEDAIIAAADTKHTTDALNSRLAEARARGMREAAEIARNYPYHCAGARCANDGIAAAIERAILDSKS